MKLIVLSSPKSVDGEIETINEMFQSGMEIFHLRKKNYNLRRVEEIIKQIPQKYHHQIVIHNHYSLLMKYALRGIHITSNVRSNKFFTAIKVLYYRLRKPGIKISRSFNHLSSLMEDHSSYYDYVFISPVFDSISKSGYQSAFNHHHLHSILPKTGKNVVALGGVELDKLEKAREMNFAGVALSGIIWQNEYEKRLAIFNEIYAKVKELNTRID